MNYRERYAVRQEDRQGAIAWANAASNRYGLFFYTMPNVMRVEASSDFFVMGSGKGG
jgi:hypothetical protein